ncbi:hypothetical protein [Vibrio barjaei]|uniref:hypothetical protein n=1 Tax=Vibrio barjaei TaxID=1676683 RepID=UPI0022835481|nr:hypothetical protein [Vibrio barjaei]MCY9874505.1 hypothetical protein [Vibrio barjaei]
MKKFDWLLWTPLREAQAQEAGRKKALNEVALWIKDWERKQSDLESKFGDGKVSELELCVWTHRSEQDGFYVYLEHTDVPTRVAGKVLSTLAVYLNSSPIITNAGIEVTVSQSNALFNQTELVVSNREDPINYIRWEMHLTGLGPVTISGLCEMMLNCSQYTGYQLRLKNAG